MAITPSNPVFPATETTSGNSVLTLMGRRVRIPALASPVSTVESGSLFATVTLDRVGFRQLVAFLNLPAPSGGATDTLDVFIDSSPDSGTTWINVVHFAQLLANGGAKKLLAVTPILAAGSASDVTADLAAAAAPRSICGDTYRVRVTTVNGSAGAFGFNPNLELFFLS